MCVCERERERERERRGRERQREGGGERWEGRGEEREGGEGGRKGGREEEGSKKLLSPCSLQHLVPSLRLPNFVSFQYPLDKKKEQCKDITIHLRSSCVAIT